MSFARAARAQRTVAPGYLPLLALRVIDVHRAYEIGTGSCRATVRALDGVTFSVRGGETLGVLGPPGSGKSTLLRIAAGMQRPDRGAVHLRDARVAEALPRAPTPDLRCATRALYLAASDAHAIVAGARACVEASPPAMLVAADLDGHELTPLARRLLRHALRQVASQGAVVLIAARRPCDVVGLTSRTLTLQRGRIARA